jgi:hypothetical protein
MSGKSTVQRAANRVSQGPRRLSLSDRLALIGLMDGAVRESSADSTQVADLFEDLSELVDATVSGAKIDRLRTEDSINGFKVFEISSDAGETLGRLNMLYLNKPIPCYYLVYVEVFPPFRNRGLGNLVLETFKDFLTKKSALGILDNIIPTDDPTFDIYLKLDWKPAHEITGAPTGENDSVYMVFVPPSFAGRDLRDPLIRLLHHLKRKRHAIDMRDNEVMVERTIEEFKDLYAALLTYFHQEISSGEHTTLMRFMFTRFVTKLLGFRRRIGHLVGYTGGESLKQIVLAPEIRNLPVQSYAPRDVAGSPSLDFGDRELWLSLSEVLKRYPARIIEALPNYRRPRLMAWVESGSISSTDTLTIGDLLDLGFDPTRLKELTIGNEEFIFERARPTLLPSLRGIRKLLDHVSVTHPGGSIRNARLCCNPPLLVIRDRGNGYILRKKVPGIHWEEAVEQLQGAPRLQQFNKALGVDRTITATVRQTAEWLRENLDAENASLVDHLAFFVSWDLETNQPGLSVDVSGSYVSTIWLA